MRYGSVCSGIEAATAAWHHMGWEPAFFSEIEKFPRAVLEHHYPEVPLHGDFTTIEQNQYGKIDLLVGGTPCQSFSVAGLRGGLDDDRGNLALEFCRLADRERPRWIVWENVPGVLSSNGGRDFGSILGALAQLGYGLAYRVLDAQYFGVAQRRRRVFVVGYLGDWRRAAAVLFERHSMSGDTPPSRQTREDVARGAVSGAEKRGGRGGERSAVSTFECGGIGSFNSSDISSPLLRSGADLGLGCEALALASAFTPEVANAITSSLANSGTGHNKDENVIAFDCYNQQETPDVSKTVAARNDQDTASCVATFNNDGTARTLTARHDSSPCVDRGPDVVAVNISNGEPRLSDVVGTLDCWSVKGRGSSQQTAVLQQAPDVAAFTQNARNEVRYINGGGNMAVAYPINTQLGLRGAETSNSSREGIGIGDDGDPAFTLQRAHSHGVATQSAVRRLTPIECERLQGFPDNYTRIPWRKKPADQCPDGPRYKALGNSMAVPVMRWIGERIQMVDDLTLLL